MARARVVCTCRICGETFIKETKKYNRTEANSWEEWAVRYYDLCPKCWGAEQRKKEEAEPVTLAVKMDPHGARIVLGWAGNTKPVKDEIKALDYHWTEEPMSGFFGPLDTSRPRLGWYKVIDDLEEVAGELRAAEKIAEKIVNHITEVDIAAYLPVKARRNKRLAQEAKAEQIIKDKIAALPKPAKPDWLPAGRWNGRVYGKAGYYNVYIDNDKVKLTDEQAEELQEYIQSDKDYNAMVKEIKLGGLKNE